MDPLRSRLDRIRGCGDDSNGAEREQARVQNSDEDIELAIYHRNLISQQHIPVRETFQGVPSDHGGIRSTS